MLNRLIEWFRIYKRFAELQKSNDARLMLNRRLSQQNSDLKSELRKRKKPTGEKPISSAAQKHIDNMSDQYSKQKALHHIAVTRREVLIRKLALKIPFQDFIAIQAEVDAMTDVEVLAYKKPKLQIATSNSN
jgi:hypothetical protein